MQDLVQQNQSNFITSWNISDNIIIAQKAIHKMKQTKSKKGRIISSFRWSPCYKKKTQVFFSSNGDDEARSVCCKLGFIRISDLGRYLRMPFFHIGQS